MWKFVSRGIRETLERRANCRTNVYSQTSPDSNANSEVNTNLTCKHKLLAPTFTAYTKGFCGSAKAAGAKDNQNESGANAKRCWSEAVGWSSILAVGWVVCQSLCLRRFFENEHHEKLRAKLLSSEAKVSRLAVQLFNLRPVHILPITYCMGNNAKKYNNEKSDAEWKESKPYGPVTVEEALKEATDEFINTHRLIMGDIELRFGIKALEEKRYEDALEHFSAGAKLSSLESMFNVGLCYELGLGTSVDQEQAAKYYDNAARHGHADAIYNLGVFHAQGRGGFSIDIDLARTYFMKAARLGQLQAKNALRLDGSMFRINDDSLHRTNGINHTSVTPISYNTVGNSVQSDRRDNFNETSNKRRDVTAPSQTEIFLDFLGSQEQTGVPVIVAATDCSVPC